MSVVNLEIRSYERTTESQLNAFLDNLHLWANEGRLIIKFGDGSGTHQMSGTIGYIKNQFINEFSRNSGSKYEDVFCSVNLYNKFLDKRKSEMHHDNLYSYDNLTFGIDASDTSAVGSENILIEAFFNYCKNSQFPLPNAFSYTGDGGIHLYYKLQPCYANLQNALQTLKNMMAVKIDSFLTDYCENSSFTYNIDTKILKEKGFGRLPGTMNSKTGIMCEYFSTNVDSYTYQLLLDFNGNLDDVCWDKALKESQNQLKYGKGKHPKLDFNKFLKSKKKNNFPIINNKGNTARMLNNRINGFLRLADTGYNYFGYEQAACFAMSRFCKTLNMSEKEELAKLNELNSKFYNQVPAYEIKKIMKNKSFKKYKNETLAEAIGLTDTDPEFIQAFNVRVPKIMEYGMKSSRVRKAKSYIAISKDLLDHPDATNKEIVERTGFSIDQVKRAAAIFRNNYSDLVTWANTTLDDYDFIMEYFSDEMKKKEQRWNKNKKNNASSDKVKDVSVTIPDKFAPSVGKRVVIKADIILTNLSVSDVIYQSERLVKNLVDLKKEANKIKTRDPKNNRIISLKEKCKFVTNIYISSTIQISRMEQFMYSDLRLPRYTAYHIAYGYIHYSKQFLQIRNNKYDSVTNIPVPNTELMYNEPVYIFPEYGYPDTYTFLYAPSTIEHSYFRYTDYGNSDSPVPDLYFEAYYKYKYQKTLYYSAKSNYKNAVSAHNTSIANGQAMSAQQCIQNMKYIEQEYLQKLSDYIAINPEYKDFDSTQINRQLRKYFINKSNLEKHNNSIA